jgi:NAD-dependent SIR2 family protein deacetylase
MKKIGWPGHGYKFSCQRCGFQYPSTEIKKEWTGLHVCSSCYETRHPQTLIKIRGEEAFPSVVSKDADEFINVCTVVSSSGYADLGTADCMRADNNSIAYAVLVDMYKSGHGDM